MFSRCFLSFARETSKDLASSNPKSGPEIQHGRIGVVEGECQVFVDTDEVAVWNTELTMKKNTLYVIHLCLFTRSHKKYMYIVHIRCLYCSVQFGEIFRFA